MDLSGGILRYLSILIECESLNVRQWQAESVESVLQWAGTFSNVCASLRHRQAEIVEVLQAARSSLTYEDLSLQADDLLRCALVGEDRYCRLLTCLPLQLGNCYLPSHLVPVALAGSKNQALLAERLAVRVQDVRLTELLSEAVAGFSTESVNTHSTSECSTGLVSDCATLLVGQLTRSPELSADLGFTIADAATKDDTSFHVLITAFETLTRTPHEASEQYRRAVETLVASLSQAAVLERCMPSAHAGSEPLAPSSVEERFLLSCAAKPLLTKVLIDAVATLLTSRVADVLERAFGGLMTLLDGASSASVSTAATEQSVFQVLAPIFSPSHDKIIAHVFGPAVAAKLGAVAQALVMGGFPVHNIFQRISDHFHLPLPALPALELEGADEIFS